MEADSAPPAPFDAAATAHLKYPHMMSQPSAVTSMDAPTGMTLEHRAPPDPWSGGDPWGGTEANANLRRWTSATTPTTSPLKRTARN